MTKLQLPLSDYNRIYQVAHGVIKDVGNAQRACIFFASFGAWMLNTQYKIPARIVAGAFGLCVAGDETPQVAFFGRDSDGALASDDTGFHMWIQTETHLIDFMAPIFREAFADHGAMVAAPRKMLQRPLTAEASTLDQLAKPGDFIGLPNTDLTEALIDRFVARPANGDLIKVAEAWFGKRTGKQKPTFAMADNYGAKIELRLPATIATGAW